ncbi:MAG: class I SAM-dependent methyltransferase [Bacteroidota bacterium]
MTWFKQWFNSEYYHILYQNRDFQEAQHFIQKIVEHLEIPQNAFILDLACGKGRHSIFLNSLGYNVVGIDLSEESIQSVQHLNSSSLQFVQGDMREVYRKEEFDYVFNLFTSFGYFEENDENAQVIRSIADSLKPGGIALIDFLNERQVRAKLPLSEVKRLDDIDFHIEKFEEDGFVVKSITFNHEGSTNKYSERVRLFDLVDFEHFFDQAGLSLIDVFGNYSLDGLSKGSDRLIMLVQKP